MASLSTLLVIFSVYSSLYFLYDDVTLTVFCINKRDARSGCCVNSLLPNVFEQRFYASLNWQLV